MNVLIYVMESLRPDHLGCYGYARPTSQHLDELAAQGVRFTHAFAQATWTRPSAGSLLTGCYPVVHGATTMSKSLRRQAPSLARGLRRAGYDTAAIVATGQLASQLGFSEGFGHYSELWSDTGKLQHVGEGTERRQLVGDREVCDECMAWLRHRNTDRPFLALLWVAGTHVPYDVPHSRERVFVQDELTCRSLSTLSGVWRIRGEAACRCLVDMYDESVRMADRALGQLVTFLKAAGLYDDTLIVVLGDHGEIFNEHSRGEHWSCARSLRWASALPGVGGLLRRYRLVNDWQWTGHLDIVPYDEVVRIPLIFRVPGGDPLGIAADGLVQTVDIAPTVMDLLGIAETVEQFQGMSQRPQLQGEQGGWSEVYSDSQRHSYAPRYLSLRTKNWALVSVTAGSSSDEHRAVSLRERLFRAVERSCLPPTLLYRISDHGWTSVVSGCTTGQAMLERLNVWELENVSFAEGIAEAPSRDEEEQLVEHLRALGYLE